MKVAQLHESTPPKQFLNLTRTRKIPHLAPKSQNNPKVRSKKIIIEGSTKIRFFSALSGDPNTFFETYPFKIIAH